MNTTKDTAPSPGLPGRARSPGDSCPVNLRIASDEITLESELPGLVSPLELVIHGSTVRLRGTRGPSPSRLVPPQERHAGPIDRTVILPRRVAPRHLAARFCDGVLTLRLRVDDRERDAPTTTALHFPAEVSLCPVEVGHGAPLPAASPDRTPSACLPASDVEATPGRWRLLVDLPGVRASDLCLRRSGRWLLLTTRSPETATEDPDLVHCEFVTGAFEREFELPPDGDAASLTARLENGVLDVDARRSSASPPAAAEDPPDPGSGADPQR